MKQLALLIVLVTACGGDRDPENSALCGFSALAAGTLVLDQFQAGTTVLDEAPQALASGVIPARVVGRGTNRALAAKGPEGVVLGYEGEGFPQRPGFAVALVDDSSEVLRGVLIFDTNGPADYPQLGTISSATSTIPLYGMRIRWSAVSEPRCPLFADVTDSAAAR